MLLGLLLHYIVIEVSCVIFVRLTSLLNSIYQISGQICDSIQVKQLHPAFNGCKYLVTTCSWCWLLFLFALTVCFYIVILHILCGGISALKQAQLPLKTQGLYRFSEIMLSSLLRGKNKLEWCCRTRVTLLKL